MAVVINGDTGVTTPTGVFTNSSGFVGIGTTSPAYELDVQGTGDTAIRVKANTSTAGADDDASLVLDAAETGEAQILFYNNTDTTTLSSISRLGGGFDLRFATNNTTGMILNSSQDLQFNSGYGSVATAYGCRAWVNFNGATTPITVRGSGNISSITDNGVGDYTLNFATAMPSATYSAVHLSAVDSAWGNFRWFGTLDGAYSTWVTASAFRCAWLVRASDQDYISIAIFR